MHIGKLIDRAIDRNRGEIAFRDMASGEEITYGELEKEMNRISGYIEDRGIPAGQKTSLIARNSLETALFVLTCYYTDRPVVQLNPNLEPSQLEYFIEDSGAGALFFDSSMEEKVSRSGVESYHPLSRGTGSTSSSPGIDRDDDGKVAMIGYTSGTTGLPKGVPFSHESLFHSTLTLQARNEIKEGGELCLMYPIYHSPAVLQILSALVVGATVNIPEERSAAAALETIEETGATVIGGVPTQLKDIVEHEELEDYDTSSLRYIHTGSGLMTREIYEKVRDRLCETVCTSYGSSEAGETMYSLKDSVAIGRPAPFQKVRIVEPGGTPEDEVPQEEPGELIVRADGPQVFSGYLNKPEKTEEVMDDGWYRTGDIVREDEEGEVWFQGRKDDMIVSGGENIAPGNVENMLLAHPEVENAGVIGVADERWGQKVVGFVEGDVTRESLEEHAKESDLEDYKRPKEYFIEESLPLNETGGVERKKLRELYRAE